MKVSDYTNKEFLEKYKKAPISHPYIVFPKILELVGRIEGKKILDLGGGSGDLSRLLANKGAIVDCVDVSKEWVEICKKDNLDVKNLNCYQSNASDLKLIKDSTFDIVIMNMVLLNIDSKQKLEKTFKEVSRILKKEGSFIFTDLHPLCLMIPKSLTEQQSYLNDFSYFKDGSRFKSKVILSDSSTSIEFIDMHWTLETYTKLINDNGMYIFRIVEAQPIKNSPKIFNDYKMPEHILFYCKKN